MAWNWSPLKWISGDSNCETAATRGKAWNALCEAWPDSGPAPRFATPAHGRAEATRTTRAATYTGPCSPERQAQTDRGHDAHGQRQWWDDHPCSGFASRNKIHPGESADAAEGGGECPAALANQSGRRIGSGRVSSACAAVLEYLLPAKHKLASSRPTQINASEEVLMLDVVKALCFQPPLQALILRGLSPQWVSTDFSIQN